MAHAHGIELVAGAGRRRAARTARGRRGAAPQLDEAAERELAAAFAACSAAPWSAARSWPTQADELSRGTVDEVAGPMLEELQGEFSGFGGLARWITELRVDILDDPEPLPLGRGREPGGRQPGAAGAALCGQSAGRSWRRDASARRAREQSDLREPVRPHRVPPGAGLGRDRLHADLRRRAASRQWRRARAARRIARRRSRRPGRFLKAALRDREIRIEELQRAQMPPIAGAPKPQAHPARRSRWSSSARRAGTRCSSAAIPTSTPISRSRPTSTPTCGDAGQSRGLCRA